MTRSAATKFIPSPPARVDNRKIYVYPLLNLAISLSLYYIDFDPSIRDIYMFLYEQ